MLIQSLRRFGGEQLGAVIPHEPAVRNEKIARIEPLTSLSENMDLGRYVTKLKEHADSLGVEFPTTVEEVTIKPPLYKATVHLTKEKLTAQAKSKKEARQRAAFNACKGLRIG
jgi:dsRNA-specific ribonuclease